MTKIQDVAKAAGVSVSTVSRAFRDDTVVNENTRKLVLAKAREMGYYPNLLARGLKSRKSKMVGFLGSIETPFYVNIIQAVERELQKNGYQLLVGTSVHDIEKERDYLETLAGSCVSGIIMTPFLEERDRGISDLAKRGIPVIQLFRNPYDDLDSVLMDDEKGAYLATKALLEKGHSRILLFDIPVSCAPERADGYRRAFREMGKPVDDNLIVITSNEDIPAVIERFQPTGIVTGVYEQGKCVFQYAKAKGLHIPDAFSVVMFDDSEWMQIVDIDAIAQPVEYIGSSASRLLLERMNGERKEPVSLLLQPKYISRGSVKALNRM
jgi:transcriptional regulator, lacI family